MKIVKLKDVATITTGKTPSKMIDTYYGGDIPFVKPPNLNSPHEVIKTDEYLTESGAKKANIISKHSIMVSCIGILGKVGIAGRDLATNQQINSLTFNNKLVNYKYGYYFALTLAKKLDKISNSAVVPIVNKSNFSNLEFIFRPIEEQNAIVKSLDEADLLRIKRKKAITLLNDYLKSVYLEIFGDPVTNPKRWKLMKLKEVGVLERGKSQHRPRNAPELLNGPYPLIQTGEVANSEGYIKHYNQTYSEFGLKQSRMWPVGTLCITIAANIAKTGILTFEACFPDSIVGFTPNDKVRTEYVQSWLGFLQKIIEEKAPESAQKNINLEILRELEIPLPPIELQNKFTQIVQDSVSLKQKMYQQSQELDKQFNALMQISFKLNY